MFSTVADVERAGLCSGCGVCAGLCPTGAIRMVEDVGAGVYEAHVDNSVCTRCGLCIRVCSGLGLDRSQARVPPGPEGSRGLLGECIACYVGAATDEAVRHRGASGGMVTAVVAHLLREGLVDGAIVTAPSGVTPLRPCAVVCRTVEEVERAATSRYCPVEMSHALQQALDVRGRYVVVGLPCHLGSLAKAQHVLPHLSETFPVLLGLLCGHTPSFHATAFILRQCGVASADVASISYRGDGWPGGVTIRTRDGRRVFHSHEALWRGPLGLLFFPCHCLSCPDHSALQADICFGDAWLPELAGEARGTSVVVARTALGQRILSDMSGSCVMLDEVDRSAVLRAQDGFAFARGQPSRDAVRCLAGGTPVCHYHTSEYDSPTGRTVVLAFVQQCLSRVSSWRWTWPVFEALFKARARLRGL
jgi:coenzyme F420 hydrogenase subunit beta